LLAAASAHNPSLQRLVEQIERDRQRAALARLAWWPDFTVGVEWMYMRPRDAFVPPPNPQTGMVPVVSRMSESGTDNWGITFGFNLPIWVGKIEGGIREARSRVRASQKEYVAAQNRVRFEIEDALARVRAQRDLADLFSDTIVPQAQQAFEVSRAAYTGGEGDFLIVIDNWQKWLMFTVQYHRALGELERSVADLEVAIGVSVSELERRS
jgi:outer membrane protein TolC